ncbi:atypical membrane-integrating protein (Mistic protein) [Oceanobacillus jordanicus]|uniref:Atypical membrane-integrating protein (Mistic protein) n=1 Tax=Oceanobacillus jordanicus TaxID=2867266 RepID=A0AAW5BF64_9BACI|nr:atypical membrane-integrating protein (Mistic protein) [Oceanobacillus jordanicus]MCG3421233.1 atypical membrane-integrating protein (Mistic protein) [Oceanobacillus jordanicus]
MKANEKDYQKYSDAIDRIQEGNEAMIELFNELEKDNPVIELNEEVLKNITRAKEKYGEEVIDQKINSIIAEMLSWLDLNESP